MIAITRIYALQTLIEWYNKAEELEVRALMVPKWMTRYKNNYNSLALKCKTFGLVFHDHYIDLGMSYNQDKESK